MSMQLCGQISLYVCDRVHHKFASYMKNTGKLHVIYGKSLSSLIYKPNNLEIYIWKSPVIYM